MSSEFAIEVSNLGKCYQIYDKPSDRLKQMLFRGRRQYYKEFWALKDVSFKVKKGETVGIIGRNGSGKSTLLQMICGTLNPTAGEIKVNGKVAALLELGAGFNPEFTGVENVYMAASLYGLTKEEIDQRFETIVAFADIGEHINQPVKTYSSGMYVRLAFAVIAHVDAEILVIDEALAVGDAVFTQKCMRFIRKFKESGTLLFVSHDTGAITNLCTTAILVENGTCLSMGQAEQVVQEYNRRILQELCGNDLELKSIVNSKVIDSAPLIYAADSAGWETGYAKLLSVSLMNEAGEKVDSLKGGERVSVELVAKAYKDLSSPILGWFLKDRLGQSLFGAHTFDYVTPKNSVKAGQEMRARFKFNLPLLLNGYYSITASIADGDPVNHIQHHWIHDALVIKISSNDLRYGLVGIVFEEVEFDIGYLR